MSIDETASWHEELTFWIGHCMAAHGHHWKTQKKAWRLHDKKTPYSVHPIWCASMLLSEPKLDEDTRRDGFKVLLAHDTLEDTRLPLPVTAEPHVAALVKEMTFKSFDEETQELWRKPIQIKLFKLYDKVSNLLDGARWMDDQKWNRYVDHTLRLVQEVSEVEKYRDLSIIKIAQTICKPRQRLSKGKRKRLPTGTTQAVQTRKRPGQ